MSEKSEDMLEEVFKRQTVFMEKLLEHDKLPEWPVDLTSKFGQRLIRETTFNLIEELMEASFCLRNKTHRLTDDRLVNITHYREELGDAFAYFIEVCILSGITPLELFEEYKKKNSIVIERLKNGY